MSNPVRPLTDDERARLRESIEAHGRILVPILVDQHGVIIDGHHRKQLADELGIDCPTDQITVGDETERLAMAIEMNAARRQLGIHERAELHERLRAAGWSLRRIAEVTGSSPQTVMRDTEGATVPGGTVQGRDGVSRPATRPPVSSFNPGSEHQDEDDEPSRDLDEDMSPDGDTDDEPEPLTREEQREVDVAEMYARRAKHLTQCTVLWPYLRSWLDGDDRSEITAHLTSPALNVLMKIEEYCNG